MKRIFLAALIMLLVSQTVFAALTPVTVEREIPDEIEAGSTAEIKLKLEMNGVEVNSVIITEEVPVGWEIVDSLPKAYGFDERSYKWLVYGKPVSDITIVYTIQSPNDFDSEVPLTGGWSTIEDFDMVEGDLLLVPKQVQPDRPQDNPPGNPWDNMLMIIGVIAVVLIVIIVAALLMKKKGKKQVGSNVN